jgi:penicillin-binding protein 1C
VRQAVRFGDRLEAQRSEWFLPGTQQEWMALDAAATGPQAAGAGAPAGRITAPANGTIVALDPDIPPQRQRLALRAEGGGGLRWRVDGRELARGAEAGWLPWPGRHVLQLVNGAGRVVDEVRVEVRGAGVRR